MANEAKFGYKVSETLTFTAFRPDGSARGAVGQNLTETDVGVSGYYTATPSTELLSGDVVVVKNAAGKVVGFGEYLPEVGFIYELGSRIVNGYFESDTGVGDTILGWEYIGDWTVTGGVLNGALDLLNPSSIWQDVEGMISGKKYMLSYTFDSTFTGSSMNINNQAIIAETETVVAGDYSFTFIYDGTATHQLNFNITDEDVNISAISIEEAITIPTNVYGRGE